MNKFKTFILILPIIAFISACGLPRENKIHDRYKLRKSTFTLPDSSVLRTDGVYISEFQGRDTIFYEYLWFFKNGRCFSSRSIPGEKNIDSVRTFSYTLGQKTFYRLNEEALIIEVWGGGYINYTFHEGSVKQDTVIIKSHKSRGIGSARQVFPIPSVYSFYKMKPFKDPDW